MGNVLHTVVIFDEVTNRLLYHVHIKSAGNNQILWIGYLKRQLLKSLFLFFFYYVGIIPKTTVWRDANTFVMSPLKNGKRCFSWGFLSKPI